MTADAVVNQMMTAIEVALSEVNTTMPGVLVKYDPATNLATVKPTLPKRLADGSELPAPEIISAPVVWPSAQGGKVRITMPLKGGDPVMIHFSSRSLEGWLSGKTEAPDDPRMFDLSDAIVVPGLYASQLKGDGENLVIAFDKASITITPAGDFIFANDSIKIKFGADGVIDLHGSSIKTDTAMVSSAEITAKSIPLSTHKHIGVQPGSGSTGTPTP